MPGFLRFTVAEFSNLSIKPPPNFSGQISLSVRGIVVDSTASGSTSMPGSLSTIVVSSLEVDLHQQNVSFVPN
jgi:hypothetical protein